jgi:hypothetical protein
VSDVEEQRRQAIALNEAAAIEWADAMRAHIVAPPDPVRFAGRLADTAAASHSRARAARVADAAGLRWVAQPGALYKQPPYELRPGTGRLGAPELWEQFDDAVLALNRAVTGENARAVGDASERLGELAAAIAADVQGLVDKEGRPPGETGRSRRSRRPGG